jgi:hypothetical protein
LREVKGVFTQALDLLFPEKFRNLCCTLVSRSLSLDSSVKNPSLTIRREALKAWDSPVFSSPAAGFSSSAETPKILAKRWLVFFVGPAFPLSSISYSPRNFSSRDRIFPFKGVKGSCQARND